MKEYDLVELLVEKTGYAKYGVHKGMQGCVFDSRSMDGSWLINFPLYGEKGDIATISVEETDLKPIDCSNAKVNERIREAWGGQNAIRRAVGSAGRIGKPPDPHNTHVLMRVAFAGRYDTGGGE